MRKTIKDTTSERKELSLSLSLIFFSVCLLMSYRGFFLRGSAYARRRRERELEIEEDERDRHREKEEIEALRLQVMERQHQERRTAEQQSRGEEEVCVCVCGGGGGGREVYVTILLKVCFVFQAIPPLVALCVFA